MFTWTHTWSCKHGGHWWIFRRSGSSHFFGYKLFKFVEEPYNERNYRPEKQPGTSSTSNKLSFDALPSKSLKSCKIFSVHVIRQIKWQPQLNYQGEFFTLKWRLPRMVLTMAIFLWYFPGCARVFIDKYIKWLVFTHVMNSHVFHWKQRNVFA